MEQNEINSYLRDTKKLRRRYQDLIEHARWTIWWEKIWPVFWRWCSLAGIYATFSWLGIWNHLNGEQRFIGLCIFGILFLVFALWPFLKVSRPTTKDAQKRIAKDSALDHSPVYQIDDQLLIGSENTTSQKLWQLHQKQALQDIKKLSVHWPSPNMPKRDPYAFRFIILISVIASGIYAQSDHLQKLKTAFDWQTENSLPDLATTTGWLSPPSYTNQPAILLDFSKKGRLLRVPVGSKVVIRSDSKKVVVYPQGQVTIKEQEKNKDQESKTDAISEPTISEPKENTTQIYEYIISGSGSVTASSSWFRSSTYQFETIPDQPPSIELQGEIKQNYKGGFSLSYKTQDDYGIAKVKLHIRLDPSLGKTRSVVPPPEASLALPPSGQEIITEAKDIDISEHPWSGVPVLLSVIAIDDFGNEGQSKEIPFVLPERRYSDPLAAAVAEQRRNTAIFPDNKKKVLESFNALMIEPELFTPNVGVYIGLYDQFNQVQKAQSDEELKQAVDNMWSFVLALEDNNQLNDARSELKQAQERLQDAIARGASEDEINQLTKEYRSAMNRYMKELAEQSKKQKDQAQSGNSKSISQKDLNDYLKKIEEAMKRGDTVEAQRLMEELAQIMENLQIQNAEGKGDGEQLSDNMNQSNKDLNDLMQEQQKLQDDTFAEYQKQHGRRQEEPEDQSSQGQSGKQDPKSKQDQGSGKEEKSLAERQEILRKRLEKLEKDMKGMGMEKDQRLSDAQKNMKDSEEALKEGDLWDSINKQKNSMRNLQSGARNFAQQKQEMQKSENLPQTDENPSVNKNDNDTAQSNNPFTDSGNKKEDALSKNESPATRVQKIIEELRRKLSEPQRPEGEQNYFERLLRMK